MTIEKCVTMCSTYDFKYAGLGLGYTYDGTRCACGNTLIYPTQISTNCTIGCSGNPMELCEDSTGTYDNVYFTGSTTSSAIFSNLIFLKRILSNF